MQLDLGESTEVAVTFRGVSSDADDNGRILALDQAQLIFVCRNVDSTTLSLNVVAEAGALGIVSNASVWDTTAWGAKGLKFSFDATTIVQELLAHPAWVSGSDITLRLSVLLLQTTTVAAAVRTRSMRTMDAMLRAIIEDGQCGVSGPISSGSRTRCNVSVSIHNVEHSASHSGTNNRAQWQDSSSWSLTSDYTSISHVCDFRVHARVLS